MGNKLGKNNTYVVSGGDRGPKSRSKMVSGAGPSGHGHQDRRHSDDSSSVGAASDDGIYYSGDREFWGPTIDVIILQQCKSFPLQKTTIELHFSSLSAFQSKYNPFIAGG